MRGSTLLQEQAAQLARRGYSDAEITRQLREMSGGQLAGADVREALGRTPSPRRRRKPRAGGITTRSGRYLDLTHPSPDAIDPDDIAHALGAICRFSGQTRAFYSVAEHSLLVASMVPPECRRRALLHDATEAYLQDLPAPVKALVPGYGEIEARVWAAIATRFELPERDALADPLIKEADLTAARIEMRDLFDGYPIPARLPEPPDGVAIRAPMGPEAAAAEFRRALEALPAA